jgi:NADPH2:quinone reductase
VRAFVCSSLDGLDATAVGELPDPELRPGSVRVAIRAASVNFPDLLIIQGRYQTRAEPPFAPGSEIAGDVLEVADGVTGVAPGDRIYAAVTYGGFSEQAVVDAGQVFAIPDGMDYEVAASLPLAYGTSYHALVDRAGLAADERLLVLGAAGGVGLAATQIGGALGARIIAAVSSDEKADAVRRAGAHEVIRYDRDDLRETLRALAPEGVDVVYDPVGGAMTEAALRSTAWNGRLLVVGFASGDIPSIPANLPLLKGCSVVGVFWGRFARTEPARNRHNFAMLGQMWADGRIAPVVSATFSLDRAGDALRVMADRGAIGKLVITP